MRYCKETFIRTTKSESRQKETTTNRTLRLGRARRQRSLHQVLLWLPTTCLKATTIPVHPPKPWIYQSQHRRLNPHEPQSESSWTSRRGCLFFLSFTLCIAYLIDTKRIRGRNLSGVPYAWTIARQFQFDGEPTFVSALRESSRIESTVRFGVARTKRCTQWSQVLRSYCGVTMGQELNSCEAMIGCVLREAEFIPLHGVNVCRNLWMQVLSLCETE